MVGSPSPCARALHPTQQQAGKRSHENRKALLGSTFTASSVSAALCDGRCWRFRRGRLKTLFDTPGARPAEARGWVNNRGNTSGLRFRVRVGYGPTLTTLKTRGKPADRLVERARGEMPWPRGPFWSPAKAQAVLGVWPVVSSPSPRARLTLGGCLGAPPEQPPQTTPPAGSLGTSTTRRPGPVPNRPFSPSHTRKETDRKHWKPLDGRRTAVALRESVSRDWSRISPMSPDSRPGTTPPRRYQATVAHLAVNSHSTDHGCS